MAGLSAVPDGSEGDAAALAALWERSAGQGRGRTADETGSEAAAASLWQRQLLTDPQTSGGLLVSCAPDAVPAVLAAFTAAGAGQACVVGQMVAPLAAAGAARLRCVQ